MVVVVVVIVVIRHDDVTVAVHRGSKGVLRHLERKIVAWLGKYVCRNLTQSQLEVFISEGICVSWACGKKVSLHDGDVSWSTEEVIYRYCDPAQHRCPRENEAAIFRT